MRTRTRSIAVAIASSLLLSAPALAQPRTPPQESEQQSEQQSAQEAMQGGGFTEERQLDDARAREHFRIATSYYDEGRFREAAAQFTEAFELSQRAELLYNAYIAFREAHQSREAANALSTYLDRVPDAPDRVNLTARLEELHRAVAEQEAQEAQLAQAQADAEAAQQRADEEARARQQAEASPEAWPWVILGVGAATAIAGAVIGAIALAEAQGLVDECSNGLCPPDIGLDERRDDATRFANIADALLIGGGVVAATGLVLGLVFGLGGSSSDGGSSDDTQPTASVGCDGHGCTAVVRGRF